MTAFRKGAAKEKDPKKFLSVLCAMEKGADCRSDDLEPAA